MAALSATLLRYITHQAAASTPDAVLLQRFVADRDEEAFAALVRRHGPIVYRVCRRLVGPTAADDAFQATFLVLATRAATVRKAGSVGSWLVGVAGRVARQMRKAEQRRINRELAAASFASREQEKDHTAEAEQARILDDELTRLSDRLRGPVVACLLQGRTYEQAASDLGGSARTVRRRLDEAKRVLRARLERRGIVPAIAAGLITSINIADAAVPAGLGSRTAAAVSGFLAGGATIPAAIIAKGVATTMTTSVRMVSALVATASVGLTALGVGLAQDGKKEAPAAPPLPAATAAPAAQPATQNTIAVGKDRIELPLIPPSAAYLRAVKNEADFLWNETGRRWFGPDWQPTTVWKFDVFGSVINQPIPPPMADAIRIMYWTGGPAQSSAEITFEGLPHGRMARAWTDLSGELGDVIENHLPRQITHIVIADFLGGPLPRWADEGMAGNAESLSRQIAADTTCRLALSKGQCLRLSALFNLKEPPESGSPISAQTISVVRFLLSRKAEAPVEAVGGGAPTIVGSGGNRKLLPWNSTTVFLYFFTSGAERGWDGATKEFYRFENLAALEAAWLEWMKDGASKINLQGQVVVPATPAPALRFIPPVKLP